MNTKQASWRTEVERGRRFRFGENWSRFLNNLSDEKVQEAEESLKNFPAADSLEGKTFLDVGCGSGLFSLAARNLGATVVSFDFDPDAVACAKSLKDLYYPKDLGWHIEEGSVLDESFLGGIRQADVIYSWGVLHHTGDSGLQSKTFLGLRIDPKLSSFRFTTHKST